MSEKVIVGRFGGPYGVRGWIKVISFTNPVEKILDYLPWQINKDGEWRLTNIVAGRQHGKNIVVQLKECNDRDQTRFYTHCEIAIERSQLPKLSPDEYYWMDLEGLKVLTTLGEDLGFVDHLLSTGAHDVLVVKGDRERLIPYLNDVIVEVDLAKHQIIVNWDSTF